MSKRISEGRQAAYYIGMALQVIGLLLFLSTFVTALSQIDNFSGFADDMKSSMIRALSGMALIVVGGIIRAVGAKGLAGAGVLLDPEQARQDLEPFSRQGGGMVKDALDEAGIEVGQKGGQVIMLRCQKCQTLNEENSKFCQECGEKI